MWRLVMSRSTATLRDANRPSYTTVVSFKSEISGRTSPDLSSDMNGSRPPPSYANTSRTRDTGGVTFCARTLSVRWAAAGAAPAANAANASARLAARTRGSGCGLGPGRLHERANREFGQQQRSRRVGEQLLHGRCG